MVFGEGKGGGGRKEIVCRCVDVLVESFHVFFTPFFLFPLPLPHPSFQSLLPLPPLSSFSPPLSSSFPSLLSPLPPPLPPPPLPFSLPLPPPPQKGTGKWTVVASVKHQVPLNIIGFFLI